MLFSESAEVSAPCSGGAGGGRHFQGPGEDACRDENRLNSRPFRHCFPCTRLHVWALVSEAPGALRKVGFPVTTPRFSEDGGGGDFVLQFKGLCYFTNGTQRVRAVVRHIYNREEIVRFDSDVGQFRAVTELARPDAEKWNRDKDIMERTRAELDTVCRHNYPMDEALTSHQRVEPTVTVSLSKTEALNHHNMLVCSVTDFYPGQVKVRWFRNNQEETASVVSTPLIRNGDWTFQILVMLEMTPQRGDVYTCHVEHPSRQSPITVEWRAQSESAQSKMLSGVGGFVLGLIFLGLGLFIRQRKQKGSHGPPPAGLLR